MHCFGESTFELLAGKLPRTLINHLFDVLDVEIITSTSSDWDTCIVLMLLKSLIWRSPIIRWKKPV